MTWLKTFRKQWIGVAACLMLTMHSTPLLACPTCKDGLSDNYVGAYAFSIVFMMSVPYLLLAGFFAYMVITFLRKPRQLRGQPSDEQLAAIATQKAEQGIPTQPPSY